MCILISLFIRLPFQSREKMMRGVRRGCVRLKGAILGIDNEEDGNFTITTDSKTFHFQARNSAEREVWVRALEDTILRHAVFPHEHQVQPIVFLRKHMPHQLFKVRGYEDFEAVYSATNAVKTVCNFTRVRFVVSHTFAKKKKRT